MKSSLHRFDTTATHWVDALFSQAYRPFFEFMSLIGEPVSVLLVAAAIIGIGFKESNMRLAISGAAIPVTLTIGAILKILFERARPVTDYAMHMRIHTFSFPSGHATGSTITYGLLAYCALMKLPTPWNIIASILLALVPVFVGLSRIYLGAHFPTDVVAGWILGAIALTLVIIYVHPFS